MKLYPEGTQTDTKVRMEDKKIQIQTKWNNDLNEEKTISKKGHSHERKIIRVNENMEVHEQCVRCDEWKPLYEYFLRDNFMEKESSKESINNDIKNPCRDCCKITRVEKMVNNPDQYIIRLLYNYSKLNIEWYQQQINKNKGLISSISGIPLQSSSNGSWQVSIQNNRRDLEHLPEHCEIIALEENIPQHEAIPDLQAAYTEFYSSIIKQMIKPDSIEDELLHSKKWEDRYKLTPRQSGVESKTHNENDGKISREYDREVHNKHLKSMFTSATKAAYNHDKKSKRKVNDHERIKEADMFTIGKKQGWKCYISGVKLSMNRNSWNYLSLERLDNTKNHTLDNTVLICRLLNTSDIAQWTKDKLTYALKYQKLVDIPNEIKIIL